MATFQEDIISIGRGGMFGGGNGGLGMKELLANGAKMLELHTEIPLHDPLKGEVK